MARKYHRHVGGKTAQEAQQPQRRVEVRPQGGELAASSQPGIAEQCCPDVPPWERCPHQ